jgi:hypothetical protein
MFNVQLVVCGLFEKVAWQNRVLLAVHDYCGLSTCGWLRTTKARSENSMDYTIACLKNSTLVWCAWLILGKSLSIKACTSM